MTGPEKPDVPEPTMPQEAGYEPPAAADIDTTHSPAEIAAGPVALGGSSGPRGVEESNRWH